MSSQQFTRANAECTAALRVEWNREWKPGKLSLNTWAVSQYSSCRLSGFTGLSQSPSNADSSVVLAHKSLRTFLHALHWSADSHSGFEQLFSLCRHGSHRFQSSASSRDSSMALRTPAKSFRRFRESGLQDQFWLFSQSTRRKPRYFSCCSANRNSGHLQDIAGTADMHANNSDYSTDSNYCQLVA